MTKEEVMKNAQMIGLTDAFDFAPSRIYDNFMYAVFKVAIPFSTEPKPKITFIFLPTENDSHDYRLSSLFIDRFSCQWLFTSGKLSPNEFADKFKENYDCIGTLYLKNSPAIVQFGEGISYWEFVNQDGYTIQISEKKEVLLTKQISPNTINKQFN